MNTIHEEKIGNTTIRVSYSDYYDNPRNWGMSKMFCFHKRYDLGDKHNYKSFEFNGWNEMRDRLIDDLDIHTIFPLYLYDHSGLTISTKPFSCKWDSGQVGWVFLTKKDIKEFGIPNPEKFIDAEVIMYDKYLRGEVYQFELIQNDEVMDSCGGFYDLDECIDTAKETIIEFDSAEEVKQ